MLTTLVVPCFNEATRLDAETFLSRAEPGALHFVFVDDGSQDATYDVLQTMTERAPETVTALRLEQNAGKAEAVRRGMVIAQEEPSTLVGFWDADLATPLDELPALAAHFENAEELQLVIGSRVLLMGRHIARKHLRHYVGRVFATAVSMVLALPIYDTQCGAKVFRNNDLTRQIFADPFLSRWIFDVEIIARLKRIVEAQGAPDMARYLIEHPLMAWTDVSGGTLRLTDFIRSAADLARIRSRYLR